MDKQQKIALILLPILAVAIIAGGMSISKQSSQASAVSYTDGTYVGEGQGFAGPIKVEVEVAGGKIASINLLEHGETQGIGDKGAEEVIARIISEQKTDVDVATGATGSSEGVMEAVKNALAGAGGPQSFTDGEFEGEGQGFAGPIKVKVVVEDGKITSIEILDHSETAGLGDVGAEEVIESIIAEQTLDVDVSTGATGSSEGVMEAVKNALAGDSGQAEEEAEEVEEAIKDISELNLADGTYEGTGKGFLSDIKVEVEVKDGKLASIEVLDHDESDGISDPAFNDIPGAIVDAQSVEIDNATGATGSSKGIKAAVMDALSGAIVKPSYENGTYEGTGKGFAGDIKVEVVVEGEQITSIELLEHGETPGLGDAGAEKVIERIIESQELDVDVSTGATASSNGLMEAVKNALN